MGAADETRADNRFDGLFATVAEQAGGIEPLFDFFFGFLCRRTDFFTVGHTACKKMLDKSFQKWTQKAIEKAERARVEQAKKREHEQEQQKQRQQHQKPQPQKPQQQPMDLDNRPKIEELTEDEEAFLQQDLDKTASGASKPGDAKSASSEKGETAEAATGDESDTEASASRPEGNGGTTDKYVLISLTGG